MPRRLETDAVNNTTIFQQALSQLSPLLVTRRHKSGPRLNRRLSGDDPFICSADLSPRSVRTPAVSPHLYLHSVPETRARAPIGPIRKLTEAVPSRFE